MIHENRARLGKVVKIVDRRECSLTTRQILSDLGCYVNYFFFGSVAFLVYCEGKYLTLND